MVVSLCLGSLLIVLFFLPRSPGLDEPLLYSAVYARQHFGHLFYPYYDIPFMYVHPPTKYWLVSILGILGLPLPLATAGVFAAAYLVVVAAVLACRFTVFPRLAALWAISATVTLYPFISFQPENVTYAEVIGRLRPDDLVLAFWLSGLFWLEASRRAAWRGSYSFFGGMSVGLACVTHWYGLGAAGIGLVYAGAALLDSGPRRVRRVVLIGLGATVAALPSAISLAPYLGEVTHLLASQAGTSPATWTGVLERHTADYRYLLHWMDRHRGDVWAAAALLALPAWIGLPPVVVGALALLARRSTRVFAAAGSVLPLAVLGASHKSPGYELPEIALFLLGCGWSLAALLDRLPAGRRRIGAAALFPLAVATSTPLVWRPSELRFLDPTHAPVFLRAMARAVIGPGASMTGSRHYTGSFYTSGEDDFVLAASPLDPAIDYIAEPEFHLFSAEVHKLYRAGELRLAGFVFTPEAPSGSLVYFAAKPAGAPLTGFVAWRGRVQRFVTPGQGWQLKMLSCRASPDELSWVSPPSPVPIAGFVPRTDHCVARALAASGFEGRFASLFLRRTASIDRVADRVLLPLLIDDAADAGGAPKVATECACETLEAHRGGLVDVPSHWLAETLRQTDRTIRFYADAADLRSGRSMDKRFYPTRGD